MFVSSVMWWTTALVLVSQLLCCLSIRRKHLTGWIGLSSGLPSRLWVSALPSFVGSIWFILVFVVVLMLMGIYLCRVVFVKAVRCPLFSAFWLLKFCSAISVPNPLISGLVLPGSFSLLLCDSAYAHDTSLVISSDRAFSEAFDVYSLYERGSGAKLN